jgi:hypothetical protein
MNRLRRRMRYRDESADRAGENAIKVWLVVRDLV